MLHNAATPHCLAIDKIAKTSSPLEQWYCSDGPAQRWYAYALGGAVVQLKSVHSQFCAITQWTLNGTPAQRWRPRQPGASTFTLNSANTNPPKTFGAQLVIYDCDKTKRNQGWWFYPAS